jgi:type VI protein secretion system component VasK
MRMERRRIIGGVLFVLAVLAVVQLWAANRLATQGTALADLEARARLVEEENQELNNRLTYFSSLARIASDSARLGLTEADRVVYLSPPPALASRRR